MNFLPSFKSTLRTRSAVSWLKMDPKAAPLSRSYSTPKSSSSSPSSTTINTSPAPPPEESEPPITSSSLLDKLESGIAHANSNSQPLSTRRPPKKSSSTPNSDYMSIFSPSLFPTQPLPKPLNTPSEIWRTIPNLGYTPPVTPTSARSFPVMKSDIGRAYRLMNRVLYQNNVKRELKRQERFEGPSDKRVRLDSERHRKRFKVAVGKAVGMAMRMKNL